MYAPECRTKKFLSSVICSCVRRLWFCCSCWNSGCPCGPLRLLSRCARLWSGRSPGGNSACTSWSKLSIVRLRYSRPLVVGVEDDGRENERCHPSATSTRDKSLQLPLKLFKEAHTLELVNRLEILQQPMVQLATHDVRVSASATDGPQAPAALLFCLKRPTRDRRVA